MISTHPPTVLWSRMGETKTTGSASGSKSLYHFKLDFHVTSSWIAAGDKWSCRFHKSKINSKSILNNCYLVCSKMQKMQELLKKTSFHWSQSWRKIQNGSSSKGPKKLSSSSTTLLNIYLLDIIIYVNIIFSM